MGKAGAGKRSEKRPLLQTGIGKALFGLLVLAVACAGGYWFWQSQQPDTFYYRNMEMTALDGVERNTYIPQAFVRGENGWISYPDALQGVDVSVYQGEIDWQAVADSGVEFAMIRVGYRGYSQGAIQPDTNFQKNMEGALKAGLDVGVYFFSQATTVREAEEEADYVLEAIRNYPVTYPVVFDWERQNYSGSRTQKVPDTETMCRMANAFCEEIQAEGYQPMVYFYQNLAYNNYDLSKIMEHPFWLAQYTDYPSFYYDFEMWQYTSSGRVAGISGDVDLNLRFFRDGSKDDLTEVWKDPDGQEDPQEEIQEVPQEEQEDSGKDSQEGQQPSQDIPQ